MHPLCLFHFESRYNLGHTCCEPYAHTPISCETEIWELLNALKQENDNLELQRDMEDHHNTDEYAETVGIACVYFHIFHLNISGWVS